MRWGGGGRRKSEDGKYGGRGVSGRMWEEGKDGVVGW